jgi:hypothetical protein
MPAAADQGHDAGDHDCRLNPAEAGSHTEDGELTKEIEGRSEQHRFESCERSLCNLRDLAVSWRSTRLVHSGTDLEHDVFDAFPAPRVRDVHAAVARLDDGGVRVLARCIFEHQAGLPHPAI